MMIYLGKYFSIHQLPIFIDALPHPQSNKLFGSDITLPPPSNLLLQTLNPLLLTPSTNK